MNLGARRTLLYLRAFGQCRPCCIQARGMLMEGLEGGYRRYRCKIEREWWWACVSEREKVWVSVWAFVCVRRFHGNLSGVCLVPGDRERERERWETRRKLSLVKGRGGEWDKLMGGGGEGKVGLPPPLCPPLPPYQPSIVYFLQPWQASFSLSLSRISSSVPLQGNFKACRVCVLCHTGGFLGNNQVHKTLRKSPRHHRFLLTQLPINLHAASM